MWLERLGSTVWRCVHKAFGENLLERVMRLFGPVAYRETLFRREGTDRIFLTIDDAPGDPEQMHRLLDALRARWGTKATFFVIGSYLDLRDDGKSVMRRAVQDGHTLGNHLMEDRAAHNMSPEEFETALLECESRLCDIDSAFCAPGRQKYFRAPCGMMASFMTPILLHNGYTSVLGDVYPNDCAFPNMPDFIAEFVLDAARPGSILILHCPEKDKRPNQVEAISRVTRDLCVPTSNLHTW